MTTVHLIRNLQAMVTNAAKAQRQTKGSLSLCIAEARKYAESALRIAQEERANGPAPRKVYRNVYRGPV